MNDFSLLVAMCLGDGNLTTRIGDNRFNLTHSTKQEEYLNYKKHLLEKCLNKQINSYYFDNHGYPGIRFSVSHPIFETLRELLYCNGNKTISLNVLNYLDPLGIALWYMDDGSLSRKIRDGRIHAYELSISTYCSELEVETIIYYFSCNWNIQFSKRFNKGKFSIRCGTQEARKFIEIIRPFIIPSMFYKIQIDTGKFSNTHLFEC